MLFLEGALDLEVDGKQARLSFNDDKLSLEVARPRSFLAAAGLLNLRGLAVMRSAAAVLHGAGLTLTVYKKGKRIIVMGYEAHSGVEGWVLQIPFLQIPRGGTLLRFISG